MHIHFNMHHLTRALKVTQKTKEQSSPRLTPPSLLIFLCFFFFSLFLSVSLSSPSIFTLIGPQTACKCSNPKNSPGALVIGCALQHWSQSIKARWAPVNSFSLQLLCLWSCHMDSNFALNPSTVLFFLFVPFTFLFQSWDSLTLLPLKTFFFFYTLALFFFLAVPSLKSLRAHSPFTHLVLSS